MSLEQLVIEARQGSTGQAAFAEVCRRFTGLVKKYANQPHLTGLNEEATAEGWLVVAQAVQTYEQDSGVRFAGFVESKVKYAIWNLFKRERRRWQQELPLTGGKSDENDSQAMALIAALPATDNVEASVEKNFIKHLINESLDKLPEKQQVAIVKTLLEGAKLADVAAQMGVSPQAVYGLRQRGLSQLKRDLLNKLGTRDL